MARKSQVFQTRDMNKTVRDVVSERDYKRARLINYAGNRKPVGMKWDINEASRENQIFELTIGQETALLSWEEMQRYGRWI